MFKIHNHMNEKKQTQWINIFGFKHLTRFCMVYSYKHYIIMVFVVYELLKSYLTGRKQFVYINGSYSTTKTIQFGVPQGSNLGPTLFSIYVNDIFNTFDLTFVLYADDTCYMSKLQKKKI